MLSEEGWLLLWGGSAVWAMSLAMGRDRPPLDREAMELCDACLEPVRRDRRICRHCGARAA